jgi:hypothetical protein
MGQNTEYISSDEDECVDDLFEQHDFTICLSLKKLNELVSTKSSIKIIETYTCYCHDEDPRENEIFEIHGDKLTNKYVIEQLINQGISRDCNHCFLESIECDNNGYYSIFWGS